MKSLASPVLLTDHASAVCPLVLAAFLLLAPSAARAQQPILEDLYAPPGAWSEPVEVCNYIGGPAGVVFQEVEKNNDGMVAYQYGTYAAPGEVEWRSAMPGVSFQVYQVLLLRAKGIQGGNRVRLKIDGLPCK